MTSSTVLTSESMEDTQGGAAEASPSQNLPRKRKLEETRESILNEVGKQVKLANSPPVMIDCVSPYYSHDEEGIDEAEAARRKALIWYSVRRDMVVEVVVVFAFTCVKMSHTYIFVSLST